MEACHYAKNDINIVATDDQEDHKVRKLAKEQPSQLN